VFEEHNQDAIVRAMSEHGPMNCRVSGFSIKDLRSDLVAEKAEKKQEKLVKDYHSPREDFNQLFSEIQGKREASTAKVLDRIPDLKTDILREEWAKAFKEGKQSQP
jgi:chromatin segregation and condensation protein Rec8/ScpA/Scc1 (kleisin family)